MLIFATSARYWSIRALIRCISYHMSNIYVTLHYRAGMTSNSCLRLVCLVSIYCNSQIIYADNSLPAIANTDINVYSSSVEKNILAMDKNGDGMVSVVEVRAFIESQHGKAYQKDVLDEMESSINGKSCSTPFAKPTF